MSDFHQTGVITTLHRLGPDNLDTLERDLEKTATPRPVGLVLPCQAAELDTPALPRIERLPATYLRCCARSWRATRAMR